MNISNNNYSCNSNYSFKAVKMSPEPAKWNQQVLSAVLNSKHIRNIIENGEKNGEDTFLHFYKMIDPPMPECPAHRDMFFQVSSGDKMLVNKSSKSTYHFIPGERLFEKPREIKTGPEDIAADLSYQIKKLDGRIVEKSAFDKRFTLSDLRKMCSELIYEKEIPIKD
ncbi:MAG: hypothetical protein LUB59_02770 [Candidatus Gastranaerophilales bacterium]|nr:hypothetical protein [Candidatus Gastranaerophilales bacterium]